MESVKSCQFLAVSNDQGCRSAQITLMRIRVRIQLFIFTSMLHFEPSGLHCQRPPPSSADPDPASKTDADSCRSCFGSATLVIPGNSSRLFCRPDETGLCDQCGGLLPSCHLPLPHLHTLSPLQKGDILFSERIYCCFFLFLIKFTCLSVLKSPFLRPGNTLF
jgi:hypothetical protein